MTFIYQPKYDEILTTTYNEVARKGGIIWVKPFNSTNEVRKCKDKFEKKPKS